MEPADIEEFRSHHYEDKNCYEIFEVDEKVKAKQLKGLYMRKRRYYRPDRWPRDLKDELEKEYKLVSDCYYILSKPANKQLYDRSEYNLEYALHPSTLDVLYYTAKNKFLSWLQPLTDAINRKFKLDPRGRPRFGGKPAPKKEI